MRGVETEWRRHGDVVRCSVSVSGLAAALCHIPSLGQPVGSNKNKNVATILCLKMQTDHFIIRLTIHYFFTNELNRKIKKLKYITVVFLRFTALDLLKIDL